MKEEILLFSLDDGCPASPKGYAATSWILDAGNQMLDTRGWMINENSYIFCHPELDSGSRTTIKTDNLNLTWMPDRSPA